MKSKAVLVIGLFLIPITWVSLSVVYGESGDKPPKGPFFANLGDHHHAVTTASPEAQRYFDQGLILAYAFNHAEAERSFREAARIDPKCAMCYWGAAWVLGPNINAAMEEEAVSKAFETAQKALSLSAKASPREQAYIRALSKRYPPKAVKDRTPYDEAFAQAMREVVRDHPEDLDAAALLAEALMDIHPWDYWSKDGKARPWTPEITGLLESILKRNPNHIAANHLYIHAVEASPHPERALPSADRLRDLVPGAGHLVHMPSHIYIHVGRYHEVSAANERALKADEAYFEYPHADGIYPLGYYPHNAHFLWTSATMEGRSETAIRAARNLASRVDTDKMRQRGYGTLQHYYSIPLYSLTRFGKWDEILQVPAPEPDLVYPKGVWHYARAMAFIRKGRTAEADRELKKLEKAAGDPALEGVTIWEINTTSSLLRIAHEVAAGEMAAAQARYDQAALHLNQAVRLEGDLNYDEPPPWYFPVRQALGAVLMEAGRAGEAERVYREDLKRYRENGWSLFGLRQALIAQKKDKAADRVEKRFQSAWSRADVVLTSSRF